MGSTSARLSLHPPHAQFFPFRRIAIFLTDPPPARQGPCRKHRRPPKTRRLQSGQWLPAAVFMIGYLQLCKLHIFSAKSIVHKRQGLAFARAAADDQLQSRQITQKSSSRGAPNRVNISAFWTAYKEKAPADVNGALQQHHPNRWKTDGRYISRRPCRDKMSWLKAVREPTARGFHVRSFFLFWCFL